MTFPFQTSYLQDGEAVSWLISKVGIVADNKDLPILLEQQVQATLVSNVVNS